MNQSFNLPGANVSLLMAARVCVTDRDLYLGLAKALVNSPVPGPTFTVTIMELISSIDHLSARAELKHEKRIVEFLRRLRTDLDVAAADIIFRNESQS